MAGQLWVMSTRDARSWDSRYLGPVLRADAYGVYEPVVTVW
jgi:type IV secretory pathway protease TraF